MYLPLLTRKAPRQNMYRNQRNTSGSEDFTSLEKFSLLVGTNLTSPAIEERTDETSKVPVYMYTACIGWYK